MAEGGKALFGDRKESLNMLFVDSDMIDHVFRLLAVEFLGDNCLFFLVVPCNKFLRECVATHRKKVVFWEELFENLIDFDIYVMIAIFLGVIELILAEVAFEFSRNFGIFKRSLGLSFAHLIDNAGFAGGFWAADHKNRFSGLLVIS